ncbi:MAG: hypothetical protein ICV79_25690 [Flavisolibacter sp.]|nr:hypothetical protein [Flavisolibacter sp.]
MNKGILFGHQDDLAYGVGWKYEKGRSDIKDVAGDYPAVQGYELGHLELDSLINLDSVPFLLPRRISLPGCCAVAWTRRSLVRFTSSNLRPLPGLRHSPQAQAFRSAFAALGKQLSS